MSDFNDELAVAEEFVMDWQDYVPLQQVAMYMVPDGSVTQSQNKTCVDCLRTNYEFVVDQAQESGETLYRAYMSSMLKLGKHHILLSPRKLHQELHTVKDEVLSSDAMGNILLRMSSLSFLTNRLVVSTPSRVIDSPRLNCFFVVLENKQPWRSATYTFFRRCH